MIYYKKYEIYTRYFKIEIKFINRWIDFMSEVEKNVLSVTPKKIKRISWNF